MEYFILENDWDGQHLIFKDKEKARLQMIKWYYEKFMPESLKNIQRQYEIYMDLPEKFLESVLKEFKDIQRDIKSIFEEDYIDGCAYLYGAEFIE